MSATQPGHHWAAVLAEKGHAFQVQQIPTPHAGDDEVLINTKAFSVAPLEVTQRDNGFPSVAQYPSIIGSEIAGVITEIGSSVPQNDLKIGARVGALTASFATQGEMTHGGYQEYVRVPWQCVFVLPDNLEFTEASALPLALVTAWAGWNNLGIPMELNYKAPTGQLVIVWGAASSVGVAAVQLAKYLGFVVYAVASEKHHDEIKRLGASDMFDYKDPEVIEKVTQSIQKSQLSLRAAFQSAGLDLRPLSKILSHFVTSDHSPKIASAPPIIGPSISEGGPPNLLFKTEIDGIESKFVSIPNDDEARSLFAEFVLRKWLVKCLASGDYIPCPPIKVVGYGIDSANMALDLYKKGVSFEKIVVKV